MNNEKGYHSPIGIAEYRLMQELPKELKSELPSIEILESELADKILTND